MGARSRVRAAVLAGLAALDIVIPASVAAAPTETQAMALRPRQRSSGRRRSNPIPTSRTRWLQADVENATRLAAAGDLTMAAQLYRSFQRDGTIQGLLGTRTGGLIRLPKRFRGSAIATRVLEGEGERPGLFDRVFPAPELQALDADGVVLGVGVAEFILREDDPLPRLVRLDPEFLRYRAWDDSWHYQTATDGLVPVTPGDGRWVLHTPMGRYEPWNRGAWQALARAYVAKEHAILYRENYAGKLANPARVAVSPQGGSEMQKQSWFRQVMAWGVNSVFAVTPGYDVKLLESNGRGYEVFKDIIATCDQEFMVSIAGQIVTVTGGAGFANANIHATIRSDLIQGDGNALAATLEEQAIPPVVYDYAGPNELAAVAWDTRPPADMQAGAASLTAAAEAITALGDALGKYGLALDVGRVASRFAVPVKGDMNGDAVPDTAPAPAVLPAAPAAPAADVEASADEAAEPTSAAALAAKMTEHGIARCEHGSTNRCRNCGIERVRDFEPGANGADHTWRVVWKAIATSARTPRRQRSAVAPVDA